MIVIKQIETEINIEDGYYHLDSGVGHKEYWEVKNESIIINFSITKSQITFIKNDIEVKQYWASPIISAVKISQADFLEAKHLLIDRITE